MTKRPEVPPAQQDGPQQNRRPLANAVGALVASTQRVLTRLHPHRWGITVTLGCLTTYLGLYIGTASHSPGADGFYGWLYARSLAFDGDIDFANDYELCGDPWRNAIDRGTGHLDNPFYPGPSLFWMPVLWVLKHIVPFSGGEPLAERLGCRGTLTALTLALGPLLGTASVAFGYRAARRFVSDGEAALAAAFVALGGSVAAYSAILPSYSHVYAAFTVALLLWTTVRVDERSDLLHRWGMVALALMLCTLQRLNFASMAAVPAALALRDFRRQPRALALRLSLMAGAIVAGAIPTLLLYRYLYGTVFMLPQGRYYVQFGHAHPFLLLFSPNGGLLFATPAMWLPILGIVPGLRRHRWLVVGILLTACVEIYVAACPLSWDGGATYGARVLTPLTPIFILLASFFVARAHQWLTARPGRMAAGLAIGVIVPFGFTMIGAVAGLPTHQVPMGGASQAATYGAGNRTAWEFFDDEVGDLSVLPAELLFSWRYGLPLQSFRRATYPRIFERDYKSMEIRNDVISFATPDIAPLVRGFRARKGGATIPGRRASVVFTAHWPYATRVAISATGPSSQRLRVGLGRFWGTKWLGEVPLNATVSQPWPALPIPRSEFDSGLNEFVFVCDPAPCHDAVVVQAIRLHDDNTYLPAL